MAGSDTPCKYREAPPGFTDGGATSSELQAAGFHRGARVQNRPEQTLRRTGYEVLRDPDGRLRQVRFRVLRDPEGRIVATWGEGRWWTPDEFSRHFLAEGDTQQANRAERRRRRRRGS